jgi:hypothetical protein
LKKINANTGIQKNLFLEYYIPSYRYNDRESCVNQTFLGPVFFIQNQQIKSTTIIYIGTLFEGFRVVVLNTTFNNISVISWRSVLLMEETGGPRENHQPAASH